MKSNLIFVQNVLLNEDDLATNVVVEYLDRFVVDLGIDKYEIADYLGCNDGYLKLVDFKTDAEVKDYLITLIK
jgi:hypothetical protein